MKKLFLLFLLFITMITYAQQDVKHRTHTQLQQIDSVSTVGNVLTRDGTTERIQAITFTNLALQLGVGGGGGTGLQVLDEGNGNGWRLTGRTAANYGNIGLDAIDFSLSSGISSTRGSTGIRALSSGYDIINSGNDNAIFGNNNTNSGSKNFMYGNSNTSTYDNTLTGGNSATSSRAGANAIGSSVTAFGQWSSVFGLYGTSYSLGEFVVGLYPTTYTPTGQDTHSTLDRALTVGIGTGTGARLDGFRVWKDGSIDMPSYGVNTHTGTPAYNLVVDASGNILEDALGAGGGGTVDISGTPAQNQVAYFFDGNTIQGDPGFTFLSLFNFLDFTDDNAQIHGLTQINSSSADANMIFNNIANRSMVNFIPHTDGSLDLGLSGNRWSTVYANAGNFTGAITASNVSGTNTGDNAVNTTYSDAAFKGTANVFNADNDFIDDVTSFQDNADRTKEVRIEASTITTGTIRTITMPDADVALADIGTNTGDISTLQSDIVLKETIAARTRIVSSGTYTTANLMTDNNMLVKLEGTTSAITLDDTGLSVDFRVTVLNNTGGPITPTILGAPDNGLELQTLVAVADGNYAWFTLHAANTWSHITGSEGGAGGGDVSKVGTPVDNQIGVWTGNGTIEGDANFNFTGTTMSLDIGVDDIDFGQINLYGDNVSSGYANIDFYNNASYDTNINAWRIGTSTTSGDFGIRESVSGTNAFAIDDVTDALSAPLTSTADIVAIGNTALITKEYGDANYGGAGGGDVVGPASSTDDNIATFDLATGKLIQDSGVGIANVPLLDAANTFSSATELTVNGGVRIGSAANSGMILDQTSSSVDFSLAMTPNTAIGNGGTSFGQINIGQFSNVAIGNATTWVATDYLLVAGNGTGTGGLANTGFYLKKNGEGYFEGLLYSEGGLKSDTVDEYTATAGVTIDGVLIKDNLVDARDVSADGAILDALNDNTINAQTGTTYPIVDADKNKWITLDNAAAITVSVNTTLTLAIGTKIHLINKGAGQVTVGGTATVNTTETLKLRKQWSVATLMQIATDVWLLTGDLELAP
jgi:hypothetical protein